MLLASFLIVMTDSFTISPMIWILLLGSLNASIIPSICDIPDPLPFASSFHENIHRTRIVNYQFFEQLLLWRHLYASSQEASVYRTNSLRVLFYLKHSIEH
ncbi:hypothetical protein RJT34_25418 [Clitoria ternatea]|uniref:Uncharacterized protein n=1 Tax=Clitoria ternatea TaxID=43366 RepID=A0AAN9FPY5_CLITE